MPVYETLDAVADSGGTQAIEPKVTRTQFRDIYEQVSSDGRSSPVRTLSLSFTGDAAESDALIAFFSRHGGIKPFWFSFDKVEPLRLMMTEGAFNKNHSSGLKYIVTVTLRSFGGLNVS